jgi:hypothetical protein
MHYHKSFAMGYLIAMSIHISTHCIYKYENLATRSGLTGLVMMILFGVLYGFNLKNTKFGKKLTFDQWKHLHMCCGIIMILVYSLHKEGYGTYPDSICLLGMFFVNRIHRKY